MSNFRPYEEKIEKLFGRPQTEKQFIKGDGTLVQSVDGNAINIYFNTILSHLLSIAVCG